MKQIRKKAYIQPEVKTRKFICMLMQTVPTSIPQGNRNDPEVENENEILSKGHSHIESNNGDWGDLW